MPRGNSAIGGRRERAISWGLLAVELVGPGHRTTFALREVTSTGPQCPDPTDPRPGPTAPDSGPRRSRAAATPGTLSGGGRCPDGGPSHPRQTGVERERQNRKHARVKDEQGHRARHADEDQRPPHIRG